VRVPVLVFIPVFVAVFHTPDYIILGRGEMLKYRSYASDKA
jgi:hypothetical protein